MIRILQLVVPGVIAAAAMGSGCTCDKRGGALPSAAGFNDTFERTAIGDNYRSTDTGSAYSMTDGKLHVQGARNYPLWLKRPLPRDVRIEFDAASASPEGDIKVELFGDGYSHAVEESYTSSGYVVIFGGWQNSLNVLARMNEHGDDRVVGKAKRVEQGRVYRFVIERKGNRISAAVDGEELVSMDDAAPLDGTEHRYFAFNNWETSVTFDNLKISELK